MVASHEYDVRMPPPWSIVTDSRPATDPANDTRPAAAARTGTPGSASRSTPQCPANRPSGANPATIGPGTGRTRTLQPEGGTRSAARTTRTICSPRLPQPDRTVSAGCDGFQGRVASGGASCRGIIAPDETEFAGGRRTIPAHHEAISTAQTAAAAIADKKGLDVSLLDVSDLVVVTDLFLIATGTSTRHVKTLVEEVEYALKSSHERKPFRREGQEYGHWVLLDYGDVIVHVFDQETRDYYELERLWGDAPRLEVETAVA